MLLVMLRKRKCSIQVFFKFQVVRLIKVCQLLQQVFVHWCVWSSFLFRHTATISSVLNSGAIESFLRIETKMFLLIKVRQLKKLFYSFQDRLVCRMRSFYRSSRLPAPLLAQDGLESAMSQCH